MVGIIGKWPGMPGRQAAEQVIHPNGGYQVDSEKLKWAGIYQFCPILDFVR
jgi:hypothetical protein